MIDQNNRSTTFNWMSIIFNIFLVKLYVKIEIEWTNRYVLLTTVNYEITKEKGWLNFLIYERDF